VNSAGARDLDRPSFARSLPLHLFTVHGLRRTFNDLTRRAGADGMVTRALTGHVTEAMTAHYSTVGLDEKREAVAGVVRLVPLTKTVDRTVDGDRN